MKRPTIGEHISPSARDSAFLLQGQPGAVSFITVGRGDGDGQVGKVSSTESIA